jgi:hypothetical protein
MQLLEQICEQPPHLWPARSYLLQRGLDPRGTDDSGTINLRGPLPSRQFGTEPCMTLICAQKQRSAHRDRLEGVDGLLERADH